MIACNISIQHVLRIPMLLWELNWRLQHAFKMHCCEISLSCFLSFRRHKVAVWHCVLVLQLAKLLSLLQVGQWLSQQSCFTCRSQLVHLPENKSASFMSTRKRTQMAWTQCLCAVFQDFEPLPCNYRTRGRNWCLWLQQLNLCRNLIAVYKVKCNNTGKVHIGNTQQKFKARMQQHFNEVQKLVKLGKKLDSHCAPNILQPNFMTQFHPKSTNVEE